VIIHQDGRPIARLIPLNQSLESPFGAMEGEFELPEDWDRPLTDTETDAFWEGAW
jgi:antitoxin (DNA-binding transcriptional repressor) of toxin-antitoxin stability system